MDQTTIKNLIPDYYKKSGFDADGGKSAASVKIVLVKGINIYLPNTKTRKKVILTHDVHHLLTGYSTDLKGETEISTWELSTNCTNNYAAFILNTYAMALGLLINLPGVWKAWLRGRYTCNLYRKKYSREELVNKNLEELKKELKLFHEPKKYKGSFGIFSGFLGFSLFSLIFSGISMASVPFVVLYSIIISIKKV